MSRVFALVMCMVVATPAHADFTRRLAARLEALYVFRGERLADLSAFYQAGVELNDFYASAVRIEPLGDDDERFRVETQVRAGWTPTLSSNRWRADVGAQVFRRASDVEDDADNDIELFAGLNGSIPLNPSVYTYYDFDRQVFSAEAGVFHTFFLPLTLDLRTSADVGFVSSFDDHDIGDYTYVQGRADVVRTFVRSFEAYAGVRGVINSRASLVEDNPDIWLGAGASWKF